MARSGGAAENMGRKKTKKVKEEETKDQQDGGRPGGTPSGGRRPKKEKEKDLIDLEVKELMFNVSESDNMDVPFAERFKQEVLVEYLQKNVESMYPHIGEETYRVPDVHMNKGKDGEVIEEGVYGPNQPTDTDIRSDRAHCFVSDMVYHLSVQTKKTKVGPLFIITSYEYDHFLSRLKASFDEKLCPQNVDINFPKGSGHERGEIDILIVLPKHVIFLEVKAIGDNFGDYPGDKLVEIKKNITKSIIQLKRDEAVFNHVMADRNLQDFKRTKIAALPNLERKRLQEAMNYDELKEICREFKFLCKEDMPKSYQDPEEQDFSVFYSWWMSNVFPEALKEEESCLEETGGDQKGPIFSQQQTADNQQERGQSSPLDEVKVIVGRYVGFMSVVKVSNNSNSKLHRIEGRRKGQLVWYVGEKFANIVLTDTQKSYLVAEIRLGYLCGPPGSGKTVVLSLRARRWILNDNGFVVVVNMYRGAPGRAIGKQIYKTITENSDKEKEAFLKEHTMEIGVDVSLNRFKRENFVARIRSRWRDKIGDSGQNLMFIVDETYVQSYWNEVFQTLRGEFVGGALWCAGLYGKQPDKFKALELTEVIRCPPNVQKILSLIDWVDDRKRCYIKDSTTSQLPTNGPQVLTVRHKEHVEYAGCPPSQCPLCGGDLAQIFKRLQVRIPGKCPCDPDLQIWSLQCSEVIILVNMPRTMYSRDNGGYLDTTVANFRDYMMRFQDCPMLKTLNEAGYPTRVHTDLLCSDLVSAAAQNIINVTWIYTYQGLENKVIIFVPGDEGMPLGSSEDYLTDASLNIPCPGLMGSEDEAWPERKSQEKDAAMTDGLSSRGNSECESVDDAGGSTESDSSCNSDITDCERQKSQPEDGLAEYSGQGRQCDHCFDSCGRERPRQDSSGSLGDTDDHAQPDGTVRKRPTKFIEDKIFTATDINRYTRWDKNNLFISASRCTSQLILITC